MLTAPRRAEAALQPQWTARRTVPWDAGRLAELDRLLAAGDARTRYQPIVELGSDRVLGFEALSSPSAGSLFDGTGHLFAFAEAGDRILELERMCRRQALRRSAWLPRETGGGKLFVNCSAHAFADSAICIDLVHGARAAGLAPGDVVIEITERVEITAWRPLRRTLDRLREAGLEVAVDDVGAGYSSLRAVAEIEPEYLKIDRALVHDVHRSSVKGEILGMLVALAERIGAWTIAEGIERPEDLDALRRLGVTYGQGHLLGPPAPAPQAACLHPGGRLSQL